jgi:hypothetical protein
MTLLVRPKHDLAGIFNCAAKFSCRATKDVVTIAVRQAWRDLDERVGRGTGNAGMVWKGMGWLG